MSNSDKAKFNAAAYQREYRKKYPERMQAYEFKRHYGITVEDYETTLAAQNGCCAICGAPAGSVGTGKDSKGALAIDHCHTTGVIRGLLCSHCNLGLGHFADDISLLQKAIDYLQNYKELKASMNHIQLASVDSLLDELSNGP